MVGTVVWAKVAAAAGNCLVGPYSLPPRPGKVLHVRAFGQYPGRLQGLGTTVVGVIYQGYSFNILPLHRQALVGIWLYIFIRVKQRERPLSVSTQRRDVTDVAIRCTALYGCNSLGYQDHDLTATQPCTPYEYSNPQILAEAAWQPVGRPSTFLCPSQQPHPLDAPQLVPDHCHEAQSSLAQHEAAHAVAEGLPACERPRSMSHSIPEAFSGQRHCAVTLWA